MFLLTVTATNSSKCIGKLQKYIYFGCHYSADPYREGVWSSDYTSPDSINDGPGHEITKQKVVQLRNVLIRAAGMETTLPNKYIVERHR